VAAMENIFIGEVAIADKGAEQRQGMLYA